jgi:plastocyanin
MSQSQAFPVRSTTGAAILLASIIAGCSPSTGETGSEPLSPSASRALATASPSASRASATPSPSLGLASTNAPARVAPTGAVQVELAGPPPHYKPTELTAKAGEVAFFLHNTSHGTHTMAIGPVLYQRLVASASVGSGQAATFTVHDLPSGRYIFWCTIDDHAAEGMVGTLTVE